MTKLVLKRKAAGPNADECEHIQKTIHFQTGEQVYLFGPDKFLPNDGDLLHLARAEGWGSEIVGTAQGAGIETVWWDGTNRPMAWDSPGEMKVRADEVRPIYDQMLARLRQCEVQAKAHR